MASADSSSSPPAPGSVPENPLEAVERLRRAVDALGEGEAAAAALREALAARAPGGEAGAAAVAAEWAALLQAAELSAAEDALVASAAAAKDSLREVDRGKRDRG